MPPRHDDSSRYENFSRYLRSEKTSAPHSLVKRSEFENHAHQVARYFFHYNFCRIHKTLRVAPAMKAGLTAHPRKSIVGLPDAILFFVDFEEKSFSTATGISAH
jgi:hypothetical protein